MQWKYHFWGWGGGGLNNTKPKKTNNRAQYFAEYSMETERRGSHDRKDKRHRCYSKLWPLREDREKETRTALDSEEGEPQNVFSGNRTHSLPNKVKFLPLLEKWISGPVCVSMYLQYLPINHAVQYLTTSMTSVQLDSLLKDCERNEVKDLHEQSRKSFL